MVRFEELSAEYDNKQTVYPCCNESIFAWRTALESVGEVERAASICSGGEVSFFCILPKVTKELDLIDHAYGSMFWAIGKYHAIEKVGAKAVHAMLAANDLNSLRELCKEGNAGLPTNGGERLADPYNDGYALRVLKTMCIEDLNLEHFRTFKRNKDKIQFIHGDMQDLIPRGPYDLVYLSNALQYTGRNGRGFEVQKYVKPGGFVCTTHSYSGERLNSYHIPKEWEVVFQGRAGRGGRTDDLDNGKRRVYGLPWTYSVYKTPEAA